MELSVTLHHTDRMARSRFQKFHDGGVLNSSIFQNRVIVGVLIMVNFGNSIIISLEALGPNLVLSLVVSIVNTVIVILALYGIFAFKPIFVTPNVIAKISLSSAALFHGMQKAESDDSTSVFHFLWLLTSVCLFIWEIHAMFSTTFGIMKEMKIHACSKPPPSYNQVL
uniref:Aa_trans domain-containing protein n=1 Tax=Angiostrongylus cantonensis TaxID=6313 RepID=A0A0K0CVK3_ANGCA